MFSVLRSSPEDVLRMKKRKSGQMDTLNSSYVACKYVRECDPAEVVH